MTTTATTAVAVVAASFQFTRFDVQRCIRVIGSQGESLMPIDTEQDEALLAQIADQDAIYDESQSLILLINDVADDRFALIVPEGDDKAISAMSSEDTWRFPDGEYGGVRWVVQAYASDRPDEPFYLINGNDEKGIRVICAGLQSLVDVKARVRAYDDKLNAAGKAPTGDDYNALFDLHNFDTSEKATTAGRTHQQL
jgi:hypothetical protein